MLEHAYIIIFYHSVEPQGHKREVVDGFNAIYKRFLYILITTVQFPGEAWYDTHMSIYTPILNKDTSLAR